jgi:hypothetical protein
MAVQLGGDDGADEAGVGGAADGAMSRTGPSISTAIDGHAGLLPGPKHRLTGAELGSPAIEAPPAK